MKPSPELKAACLDKYIFIKTHFIPACYLYDIMITRSVYCTLSGNLGKAFQALCQHLEDEKFKSTVLGRFTHIILAAQQEVMIQCDLFYDMTTYKGGYDAIVRGRWFKKAVLERLDPIRNPNRVIEQWRAVFSTSNIGLVDREDGIEQLFNSFSFMRR
jgi:hypothetical protein